MPLQGYKLNPVFELAPAGIHLNYPKPSATNESDGSLPAHYSVIFTHARPQGTVGRKVGEDRERNPRIHSTPEAGEFPPLTLSCPTDGHP